MERKVQLRIVADASGADRARQQLVSGFQQAAQQINRNFNSINKLDGLRSGIASTGTQLDRLRNELRGVADEILRTGANGARINALREQYKGLQSELRLIENALARDTAAAGKLEAALRAAGISTEFGQGRAQLEGMARALDKVQAELSQTRQAARNLFGALGEIGRSQTAVQGELAALRQRNALIGAGTELERVERGIVLGNYASYSAAQITMLRQLATEYDAKQALLNVERQRVAAAAAQRGAAGNFLQGAASATGAGFIGGAAGAGIVAALGVGFAGSQALEYERQSAALIAVEGNAAAAAAQMQFLRDQAARLGVSFMDLSRSWVQLQAASKGTALEGDKARDVFLAVTESAQRLNLKSTETEGALRAIGQMMSKGTIQAEELRGQLGDRLPGAFNIMARALGVTTAELGDMLKAGEVLASDALPRFGAELRKTFGTDINTRIETTASNFTRLANEIKLAASVAGSLVNAVGGGAAGLAADTLERYREVERLSNAARQGESLAETRERLSLEVQRAEAVERIATAARYEPPTSFEFDPFAKPDRAFHGPGTPVGAVGEPIDLTAGVIPVDEKNLAKLREKRVLMAQTTELAKVERSIRNGELATVSKLEQAEARRFAIEQDTLAAVREGVKVEKKDDKALAESAAQFRESLAAEARLIDDHAEQKRRLNIEILEAQGLDTQAALAKLHDQHAAFAADLAGSAEGLDLADKWFNASEARIALDSIAREAQEAVTDLQARIEARNLLAASSSPAERDRLQAENAADVTGTRAAVTSTASRGALFGGGSDRTFTEGTAARMAALDNMADSIRRATEGPIAQLFRDWQDGTTNMERAAASWIDSTVSGIARMAAQGKADFRGLAESIIEEIIRIQLQAAIAGLVSGGIGQSIGGFVGRLFTGGFSSTGTYTAANLATGGMVNGPGTSTSDSIPAWLSNGEFVVNAKAVRTFGRGLFEGLNRGFAPPAARRFSTGGYVGVGAAFQPANILIENNTGAEVRTERMQRGGVDFEKIIIGVLQKDAAQNGAYSRSMANTYGLQRRPGR